MGFNNYFIAHLLLTMSLYITYRGGVLKSVNILTKLRQMLIVAYFWMTLYIHVDYELDCRL